MQKDSHPWVHSVKKCAEWNRLRPVKIITGQRFSSDQTKHSEKAAARKRNSTAKVSMEDNSRVSRALCRDTPHSER